MESKKGLLVLFWIVYEESFRVWTRVNFTKSLNGFDSLALIFDQNLKLKAIWLAWFSDFVRF